MAETARSNSAVQAFRKSHTRKEVTRLLKKKKDKSASEVVEAVKETNETLVFDGSGDIDAQVQAVMEKYDRESNVRHWKGIPKQLFATYWSLSLLTAS